MWRQGFADQWALIALRGSALDLRVWPGSDRRRWRLAFIEPGVLREAGPDRTVCRTDLGQAGWCCQKTAGFQSARRAAGRWVLLQAWSAPEQVIATAGGPRSSCRCASRTQSNSAPKRYRGRVDPAAVTRPSVADPAGSPPAPPGSAVQAAAPASWPSCRSGQDGPPQLRARLQCRHWAVAITSSSCCSGWRASGRGGTGPAIRLLISRAEHLAQHALRGRYLERQAQGRAGPWPSTRLRSSFGQGPAGPPCQPGAAQRPRPDPSGFR